MHSSVRVGALPAQILMICVNLRPIKSAPQGVNPCRNSLVLWFLPILLVSLASLHQIFAQTPKGIIRGFVRDATNGESLPYANIILKKTKLGAASNLKGYYLIDRIPPDSYIITASMMGYKEESKEVEVLPNVATTINFHLQPSLIQLKPLVVTATKTRFHNEINISSQALSSRELTYIPSLAEADLFRSLQLLPAVTALSDFSSQLYVRGGSPDQNLILLDGVTVYNPFHLGGVFSTFNLDAIKEVNFLTGGFPARYGGRISSVLDITTKEGNNKRFDGRGNISLLSSKILLEGPAPKGSFLIAARRTYFDKAYKAYKGMKGERESFPYYFYDLQGKIHLDLSQNNRLTLAGFYGDDLLHLKSSEGDSVPFRLDTEWGNRTTSLKWRSILGSRLFSEFLFTGSRFWVKLDYGDQQESFRIHDGIRDYSLKSDIVYLATPHHELHLGGECKTWDFNFQVIIDSLKILDDRRHPTLSVLYLEDKWRLSDKLLWQFGGRLSYFNSGRYLRFEPRVGFKYQFKDDLALKGSWGVYHQFLNTASSKDESFNLMDIWVPVDSHYPPTRAQHYILGIEKWLPYDLILTSEVYYKKMEHLLDLNKGGEIEDPGDDFLQGQGFARGWEILLKKEMGNPTGWLSYSWALAKRRFAGCTYFPRFDRRHSLKLVLNLSSGERWNFNLSWVFGTGFPYTQIVGKQFYYRYYVYIEQPDVNWRSIKNIPSKKFGLRYPPYHRLDLSISRKWQFKHWGLSPYLQIINLYNHRNVFIYFWNHEHNPSIRETVTMFPFFPTIGVNLSF